MALKLNRNLDNNIPITTHTKYNKAWKSLPGVFCCVFKASQFFRTPFWAVYLSATCPRASLYYVNDNVGNYKKKKKGEGTGHNSTHYRYCVTSSYLSKTSICAMNQSQTNLWNVIKNMRLRLSWPSFLCNNLWLRPSLLLIFWLLW